MNRGVFYTSAMAAVELRAGSWSGRLTSLKQEAGGGGQNGNDQYIVPALYSDSSRSVERPSAKTALFVSFSSSLPHTGTIDAAV